MFPSLKIVILFFLYMERLKCRMKSCGVLFREGHVKISRIFANICEFIQFFRNSLNPDLLLIITDPDPTREVITDYDTDPAKSF